MYILLPRLVHSRKFGTLLWKSILIKKALVLNSEKDYFIHSIKNNKYLTLINFTWLILNEKMIVRHLNPTELGNDIKTKREQAFFDYRIALSYSEERDHIRQKGNNDPFGPRYDHLAGFLHYRNKNFLKLRVIFLKYAFPLLIYPMMLLLKLLYALGCKDKLYKWYLKTLRLVTWHGGILSMGSEMGFFHVDWAKNSKLFKRV